MPPTPPVLIVTVQRLAWIVLFSISAYPVPCHRIPDVPPKTRFRRMVGPRSAVSLLSPVIIIPPPLTAFLLITVSVPNPTLTDPSRNMQSSTIVAPPLPRCLDVLSFNTLIWTHNTAFIDEGFDWRRQINEIPQDLLTVQNTTACQKIGADCGQFRQRSCCRDRAVVQHVAPRQNVSGHGVLLERAGRAIAVGDMQILSIGFHCMIG